MANPRGWDHQKRKLELLPFAYNTPCPRCRQLMLKGQDLQLGHSVDLADDPSSKGDRIEHADCNETAGRQAQIERSQFAPSRDWFGRR